VLAVSVFFSAFLTSGIHVNTIARFVQAMIADAAIKHLIHVGIARSVEAIPTVITVELHLSILMLGTVIIANSGRKQKNQCCALDISFHMPAIFIMLLASIVRRADTYYYHAGRRK
jgi:hypothetical protein